MGRRRPTPTRALLLAAALAAATSARAAPPARSAEAELADAVPGELLVGWRDVRGAAAAHAGARATLVRRHGALRLDHVRLPPGAPLAVALARYRRDPAVRYAEPNRIVRKAVVPDDPLFPQQWSLAAVGMPAAWDVVTASSITVAIVDTGIRLDHPDLAPSLWTWAPGDPGAPEVAGNGLDDDGDGIVDDVHGASFRTGVTAPTGNPMDDDVAESHGTHVAGIVAAAGNSGYGVAGVAWRARLLAVKVLHGSVGEGSVADLVTGIGYALDHGARIVNLSVSADWTHALADAVAEADRRGALVVSAAGNDGLTVGDPAVPDAGALVAPASIRTLNAIAVAAVGPGDVLPSYSNRGAFTVDVAAPGGDPSTGAILSTTARCNDPDLDGFCDDGTSVTNGFGPLAGTSMAAPHVTGLAALVWASRPGLTHHQVKARILNAAARLPALSGATITGGRIDAAAALQAPDELPAVFRVLPYAPDPEAAVTISGANFGAAPGMVTVGGTPLVVVSWSDEQIVATLPAGAGVGLVQVNGAGTSFPLLVGGFPPTVSVSASPASGAAPLQVAFWAYGADVDGTISSWEWDFGSGTFREYPQIEGSAVVTFNSPGDYEVRVRVTDDRGLTALAAVRVSAGGAAKQDSRCFVATAAYGSPLEPHVRSLRAFRDRWLLPTAAGRAAVALYYRASPPIADAIRGRPALRAAARAALAPLVLCVEEPLALPSLALAALGLAALRRRAPAPARGRARYQGVGR